MTSTSTPRIASVEIGVGTQLAVTWANVRGPGGGRRTIVDLDGWIATCGPHLLPLKRRDTFLKAAVGEHGAAVTWDDDAGDLAIDAIHLMKIAED